MAPHLTRQPLPATLFEYPPTTYDRPVIHLMSQWNLDHPAMCACSQCRYAQFIHDFTQRIKKQDDLPEPDPHPLKVPEE